MLSGWLEVLKGVQGIMITCANCGTQNNPTATVCRMCASSFEELNKTSVQKSHAESTVIMGDDKSEPAICPTCQAANEADWVFCHECGSKLHAQGAEPAVREVEAKSEDLLRTVVVQAPKPTGPAPSIQTPNQVPERGAAPPAQPPAVAPEPVRAPSSGVAATNLITCPKCSYQNSPNNAYCARCGATFPVSKTLVMSSAPPPPTAKGRLQLLMEGGQKGDVYALKDETVIGRVNGDISFPHDGFMSGRHARVVRRGNRFFLTDEGSVNGTFIRIKDEVELKPGDTVMIGRQLFRFEV